MAVDDLVGGMNATNMGKPKFTYNRFGESNEAIRVYDSGSTGWRLPPGTYLRGDTTLTMWVLRHSCQSEQPQALPGDSPPQEPYDGTYGKQ